MGQLISVLGLLVAFGTILGLALATLAKLKKGENTKRFLLSAMPRVSLLFFVGWVLFLLGRILGP